MPHDTQICDVLIVGFGPVGAVAASLLGQHGISMIVIDREQGIYDKPRAVALDHEIARVLQGIGLADAVERFTAPFSASEFFGVDGQMIKRLDMLPPPHPMSWTPSMVFLQPALEAALRARSAAFDSVRVSLGLTLTRFTQHSDGVTAYVQAADGVETTIHARYLLACDGASSTVRQLCNIPFDDLAFDQPWLVVDLIANERGLETLPKSSAQFCEPSRPTSYIICTGTHRRFEIMLRPGEDPRAMEKPDAVWRLLSRWINPSGAELWRAASYRFHALVASHWRDRNVLLAGDAAHQQPPFLGQGLCQGIRDATNLAWKLARVVRGESSASLLDTYQIERAAHVRALTSTIKGIGTLVSERDEAAARRRDKRLLDEAGGTVRSQPRQDLMPVLSAGCLGPASSGRGTLFPQPMVAADGEWRRMDDVIGGGFRLLLTSSADVSYDIIRAKFAAACGGKTIKLMSAAPTPTGPSANQQILVERDRVATDWLGRHNAAAAILRPDNYVFSTASSAADLSDSLESFAKALI